MSSSVTSTTELGLRPWLSATASFRDGTDSPRDYLERCIAVIEAHEPDVGAFVSTNLERSRADADAANDRWRTGQQLSAVDGMPLGIKDIMETADMPTEQGSPLFAGWRGRRDSAAVSALREAGAIILGKTVTTEFAATEPRGTRNPWDLTRTPGGSSSGSAAAVGLGMLPAALGTQVIGSIIRPASFCGAFGYKPSVGGLNRGGSFDAFSQSSTGVIGASLEDTWTVTREISSRVGGDPGYPGVSGPMSIPPATMPRRIAMLHTAGWDAASDESKGALATSCDRLKAVGCDVVDSSSDVNVGAVEDAIAEAMPLSRGINAWEGRWPLNTYAQDMSRNLLSKTMQDRLDVANRMTQDEYRGLLAERHRAREIYERLKASCDACVTLSATGAAPHGLESTGDPAVTVPTSLLGVPTLSLPVLRAEGLPLGLQVIGFADDDAALFAVAASVMNLFDRT